MSTPTETPGPAGPVVPPTETYTPSIQAWPDVPDSAAPPAPPAPLVSPSDPDPAPMPAPTPLTEE